MARRPLPDSDYLGECFSYNEKTGVLSWKDRPRTHFPNDRIFRRWEKKWKGKPSGTLSKQLGYWVVSLDGTPICSHRIIIKMMTGNDPDQTDHMNRVRSDNRWANLRPCDKAHNEMNKAASAKNKSGLRGVQKRRTTFRARLTVHGKEIYLGSFPTAQEAHTAYCDEAKKIYGDDWLP